MTEKHPSSPAAPDDNTSDVARQLGHAAISREARNAWWSVRVVTFGVALPVAVALISWVAVVETSTDGDAPGRGRVSRAVEPAANAAGVEFIGSKDDGAEVAYALVRPEPYPVELVVSRVGERDAVRAATLPVVERTATAVAEVARRAPELEGFDNARVPRRLPFRRQGDRIIANVGGQEKTLEWRTWKERCADGSGEVINWSLCAANGDSAACVHAPRLRTGCWASAPDLVNLFAQDGNLWVVAERPIGSYRARMVAGGRLF